MGICTVHLEQGVLVVFWAVTILSCLEAVVKEEKVTSCNTPCDVLQLTCPASHRMAIREALYSVTPRPAAAGQCSVTHSCGSETMCCEQSAAQSCVFSYSPSHLEAVHRNCSGTHACFVKTERTQEESISCPFFNPDETVSHTVLDYVCINDSATVDICQETETEVKGRTLFTMLDSRRWRNPLGGAVCRCTAESVRWPTTNTISVFVVDLRLNALRQSHCSKADVKLKSGSTTRHLDCVSSRDPRQAFPFIALLNHSNVATVELLLHSELPEFVWIGFESNEVEDIRLSCGLQGYVPIVSEDDNTEANYSNGTDVREPNGPMPVGAMAGGVVGVILVCVLVAGLIFLFLERRRQTRSKADDYSQPHDTVDDIDVYYSTPDVNAPTIRDKNSGNSKSKASASEGKHKTAPATDMEDGEVYVTAEIVRERKRQSEKKKVRIVSMPDISDDVAEYYASPWDIRDRRRLDSHDDDATYDNDVFVPELPPQGQASPPPPLPAQTAADDTGEDYAVLERPNRREDKKRRRKQEERYDHLPVIQHKSDKEVESKNEDYDDLYNSCDNPDSFVKDCDDRPEPDGCNQNAAFEDDESLSS